MPAWFMRWVLSLDGEARTVSQEIGDRFSMTGTGEKQM